MATKIKLLYDISLQISASQKAGLYRVADELFCRLAAHPEIEIYPCVGTTKGCARDYLSDCGLLHLLERTVTLPHLRFAVKRELFGVRCKENLFRILYQHKYTEILSAFDIYFSPFLPVSPFVYSSGIKSALFIHDVIPLACPHFSTPEFCRRYASWMSDVAADLIFFNSEYSKCDFFKYATLPQSAVTFKPALPPEKASAR